MLTYPYWADHCLCCSLPVLSEAYLCRGCRIPARYVAGGGDTKKEIIRFAAGKLLNENDVEKFMEGLNSIFAESEAAAQSVKTGSVVVSMTTLVRLAHENIEARPVLLSMIREAAKKKKKKHDRKKEKAKKKDKKGPPSSAKKDGKGKKPPFGGKKAPPFGGKKAPPFGKKKSSVDIDPSDTEW